MRRIFKFLLVGSSNTILSLAVYSAMMRMLPHTGSMAAISQVISYSCGIAWSYLLNNFWVFRKQEQARPTEALPRFIASQLGLMLLSSLSMGVATSAIPLRPEFIWVAVMAGITVLNFTILRKWVFRPV